MDHRRNKDLSGTKASPAQSRDPNLKKLEWQPLTTKLPLITKAGRKRHDDIKLRQCKLTFLHPLENLEIT